MSATPSPMPSPTSYPSSPTATVRSSTSPTAGAVDSLFRSNTAAPLTVTTGIYSYGLEWNTTAINQRPDRVAGNPIWIADSSVAGGKRINAAAFTTPATTFTQGDVARNSVRGFDVWQEDVALRREFPIHGDIKLQFRAEAFNVFNHPSLR